MMKLRTTFLLPALLMAGSAACIPAPAAAQAPADSPQTKKITLQLRDVPLRQALELIFDGQPFKLAIDPTVPNPIVNLDLQDVEFYRALRLLIAQGTSVVPGLTQSRDGDIIHVRIRPPAPPTPTVAEETPPELEEDVTGDLVWERIPLQYSSVMVVGMIMGAFPIMPEGMMSGAGMMGGGMMGGGMGGGMMGGGGMGGFGGGGMGGGLF